LDLAAKYNYVINEKTCLFVEGRGMFLGNMIATPETLNCV